MFVVVPMELVGVSSRNVWNQVVMEFMVWIFADGFNHGFAEFNVVHFTGLIQLVSNVVGLYHSDGNSVEQEAVFVPVFRVFGKNFFVALQIRGHGVAAVVPHIFVVHCTNAINAAQFVDHSLRHWHTGGVRHQRIEVRFFSSAGVVQGVGIWSFNSNHFTEFRTFTSGESISFFFGQTFGVIVVLLCAFDHLARHRGSDGVVFVEVQGPFQSGQEVVCNAVRFHIAVHVNPFYIVAEFEGPVKTAVFGTPLGRNTWMTFVKAVFFQKTFNEVEKNFKVFVGFAVQNVEGSQFILSQFWQHQIGDFVFAGDISSISSFVLVFFVCCFVFGFSGSSIAWFFFLGSRCITSAGSQSHHSSCTQSQHFCCCFVHYYILLRPLTKNFAHPYGCAHCFVPWNTKQRAHIFRFAKIFCSDFKSGR